MKLTNLDMVQSILSSLDSDEVNSISDTTESMQVARILQSKYYDIASRGDLPEHNQIIQLTPSNDADKPTLMYVPNGVCEIEWIKYFDSSSSSVSSDDDFDHDLNVDLPDADADVTGSAPGYQYVTILPIKQFLELNNTINSAESNVGSFTLSDNSSGYPSDFTVYYKNDRQPNYCMILSNLYVVFDAYNSTEDTTLQESKSMCYGQVVPAYLLTDAFIPDLDDQQFPLLLNEAKALAFYEMKQVPHAKAEQEIKRQWSSVQRNKATAHKDTYFNQLPDFARARGRVGRNRFSK